MYTGHLSYLHTIADSSKIPYIVAEAPFNLLVKYVKPSVWQARVMVSFSQHAGQADFSPSVLLGYSLDLSRGCQECWWPLYCPCSLGSICKHVIANTCGFQWLNDFIRKLGFGQGFSFNFVIGIGQTSYPSV